MKPIPMFVGLALGACIPACSSGEPPSKGRENGHSSPFPACDAIIKRCHELDVGEGPIHDCHDLGHDAESDAECVPKRDECLRICVPSADAGSDGG